MQQRANVPTWDRPLLHEFLYGYSGMRFGTGSVTLKPSQPSQLPGVVPHDVTWQGRGFTVSIGQHSTTVSSNSGPPLALSTRAGRRVVRAGHAVTVTTARPDLSPTRDLVRWGAPRTSSAAPGAPAVGAVDGSTATDWEPAALPATLTVPVRGHHGLRRPTTDTIALARIRGRFVRIRMLAHGGRMMPLLQELRVTG